MSRTAYSFLLVLQQLQFGVLSDEILPVAFGSLTYCQNDSSPYFNNVLINAVLDAGQINVAEKLWAERDRRSTFYFENTSELSENKNILANSGYSQNFEDCWMFHSGEDINTSNFDAVKKVESVDQLEMYLDTLNNSYQKNDPQNPYGELGEYLKLSRDVWLKFQNQNRILYYIAFKDTVPVAAGALTNYEGHGYLSNIGSLQSVRGQGFGKLITNYCLSESVKNGNSTHFLGTEEGYFPHDFYKKMGFETKYKVVGWSKIAE